MLYALDIETKCAVKDCIDKSCKHALIPHLSEITCIGVWSPEKQRVFRAPNKVALGMEFTFWQLHEKPTFVLHNGKFDLKKMLFDKTYGLISVDQWTHDTQLMAFTSLNKVSQEYLEWYGEKRKEENKKLPKGCSHRDAGALSLKTLAPYFLGVRPFWEDPSNHDSDTYVLRDCEYTYLLYEYFTKEFAQDLELKEFYEEKLMPWNKMLLDAELRGITIDKEKLQEKKAEAEEKLKEVKAKLDKEWIGARAVFIENQNKVLLTEYSEKCKQALSKLKAPSSEQEEKTKQRYGNLLHKAQEKTDKEINLDSPKQLLWLFKDYLGLDVTNFSDEESTGKEVLQKLAQEGREDIKLFLEYRKQQKLLKAFFPTYEELMDSEGVLRTSFNITGTKTGRLSSSMPNLQQCPSDLHEMFVAREGYKLVTRDASYIEPRLIAYYTECPILCDLILRDGDFHSRNAIIMCGLDCEEHEVKEKYPKERKLAKTVGLALLYGAGPNRIHQTATAQGFDWTYNHCKEVFERFQSEYETVFREKAKLDKDALKRPIKNLFGFKRMFSPEEIHMQSFNGLIQGTASMLIVESALRASSALRELGGHLLLLVHDEAVFEVPEDRVKEAEQIIEAHMTEFELQTHYGNIPLKVEGKTGRTWSK